MGETGFNHLGEGYGSIFCRDNSRMSKLEAATDFRQVFNMSATMAGQRGRVQLEQSDTCLALNMATTANERFSRAALAEMQYLFNKSHANVRAEKKWGDEFPGHKTAKVAIQRHLAMVCQSPTAGCLPCQNGTSIN